MFRLGIRSKAIALRRNIEYGLRNRVLRPRLFNLRTSERVGVIYHQPSDLCETDRVMLYALVRGLRPKYAIEIGVRWGESARIITNAMQENGVGPLLESIQNQKPSGPKPSTSTIDILLYAAILPKR